MSWPVFWVEDTGAVVLLLRRFVFSHKQTLPCAPGKIHNASVIVGQAPVRTSNAGRLLASIDPLEYHDDPRWPAVCEHCGYRFAELDEWQVNQESIYVRRSTGEHWRLRELPTGATFDAHWQPEDWRNPVDGMAVTVVLPDCCPEPRSPYDARVLCWNVDGPANPGNGAPLKPHAWTRSGDPKAEPSTLHVNPSINAHANCYHGHVQHGQLTDPI